MAATVGSGWLKRVREMVEVSGAKVMLSARGSSGVAATIFAGERGRGVGEL
jgi:hypothetical protein